MAIERKDVPPEARWNVEALYPTLEVWEKDFKKWGREGSRPRWPELAAFKGHLHDSPVRLAKFLDLSFEIDRALSKIYTYAHLKHDEDIGNDVYKDAFSRSSSLLHEFREETAWVEPEIIKSVPESFLKSAELANYRIHLEKILRLKPHTLSEAEEVLYALAGKPMEVAQRAFSALNNADIKFPPILDEKGQKHELTHATFMQYLKKKDRTLRKNAYKSIHGSYSAHENTLAELIQGLVNKHVFEMKVRHYPSCLEAALFPNQIDTKVYRTLIDTVRKKIPVLHRYIALRKKALKLDELHLYDLYVPLVSEMDFSISYDEAENLVIESVAPLGLEYQDILRKGLKIDRWVDRFENAKKRSGAYSSGCYDSMPYILMNFQGTFNDMMTLSHEAGHSMHSYYSNHHQPYQYSGYPIFVAEVASTFHEELLYHHLIKKMGDKKERAFLLNEMIDDIRSTFFRQVLFAEFELKLHEWAEKGIPLTPALIKKEYRKLNEEYYGPDLTMDDEIEIEWSRIPHFYYNFYVYQYATGLSAAQALSRRVLEGGEKERKAYLHFISSGSHSFPIDLLSEAGVDMRTQEPVENLMKQFESLVEELSKIF